MIQESSSGRIIPRTNVLVLDSDHQPKKHSFSRTNNMISVIVPIYNVERYLPYCLDSLLNNTYGDIEVICVNDGSPDSCHEILERYARADGRIRVITKSNAGVASARNMGIDAARGEWIAFVDADDAVHYRFFEYLIDAWEKDGRKADVVICKQLWHGSGELPDYKEPESAVNAPQRLTWDQIRTNMLAWAFLWGKIFRKEIIGSDRIPLHLKLSEDTYFNLRILSEQRDFRMIEAPAAKYLYRCNPASAFHTQAADRMMESYALLLAELEAFPSREGRIVSAEIAVRHMFSISRTTPCKGLRCQCRRHMKNALNTWGQNGFISKGNLASYMKFRMYYLVPALEAIGKIVHKLKNSIN